MANTPNILPSGQMLYHGRYRIERHLASGGFGNTYLARDCRFDELVAVKEFFMLGINERDSDSLDVSVSNDHNKPDFLKQKEKFLKEAKRLRSLHNEHIVKVHDFFDEFGTSYYVMEYVDGESLSALMKRTGKPLTESRVLDVLDQLLDALAESHGNGIWHLDIKPGNIMVDRAGNVKLIDFGASKMLDPDNSHLSVSSGMAYTPGYAPIEQVNQNMKAISAPTDLYAVGATVYNLLTRKTPPAPEDLLSYGIDAFDFPPSTSEELRHLVAWMMQPALNHRPQTVAEIRQYLAGEDLMESIDEFDDDDEEQVNAHDMEVPSEQTLNKNDPRPAQAVTPKHGQSKQNNKSVAKWVIAAGVIAILIGIIFMANDTDKGYEPYVLDTTEPAIAEPPIDSSASALSASPLETFTVNGVEFTMVRVEAGSFTMGATAEQGSDAWDVEKPAHQVTLTRDYYIGQTEVTQALWQAVMGSNPSEFKGSNRPVETVSWNDCQQFITKLNVLTGRSFRLPTEAEWEFAARGGNKSLGYKYSGSNTVGDVAWYDDNSGSQTHDVCTKRANELGIYDMSGNVWEWCQDWGGDYSSGAQTDPTGPSSGSSRVYRGGGWYYGAGGCRVSTRNYRSADDTDLSLGLRLAL